MTPKSQCHNTIKFYFLLMSQSIIAFGPVRGVLQSSIGVIILISFNLVALPVPRDLAPLPNASP